MDSDGDSGKHSGNRTGMDGTHQSNMRYPLGASNIDSPLRKPESCSLLDNDTRLDHNIHDRSHSYQHTAAGDVATLNKYRHCAGPGCPCDNLEPERSAATDAGSNRRSPMDPDFMTTGQQAKEMHVGYKTSISMELQPETRPISLSQLVNEVKGIYVGLVMVETKCIEVDSEMGGVGRKPQTKFTDKQWQALITLHRTLLHEHHDFMLASQHPSASPALRRLAVKYARPASMWRHGIRSFLKLLCHRLPDSQEYMLYYSTMALLYETVPAFDDTWADCLNYLSRYRMAIEDDDQRVRDTWMQALADWGANASSLAPTTGSFYHHFATLARQDIRLRSKLGPFDKKNRSFVRFDFHCLQHVEPLENAFQSRRWRDVLLYNLHNDVLSTTWNKIPWGFSDRHPPTVTTVFSPELNTGTIYWWLDLLRIGHCLPER